MLSTQRVEVRRGDGADWVQPSYNLSLDVRGEEQSPVKSLLHHRHILLSVGRITAR